jgi:ABC-type polysaccharide/polyol phosphate export permease
LGGLINGLFASNFDDTSIIPTFVLTPLTYLGGVFYSIKLLPETWQIVSFGNPILYMVNAFRYGVLGVSDIPLPAAYGVILLFIAALWLLSLRLFKDKDLRKLCKSYCAAHLRCRVLARHSPIDLICLMTRSAASRIWACS